MEVASKRPMRTLPICLCAAALLVCAERAGAQSPLSGELIRVSRASARIAGRSAQMFLANPRGIQYDAISDDASGEDSSPDFFWESAARITERGWTLEIRVPFSSLRYRTSDPQTWGILLYRNYPRDFRYQFFSAKL